MINQEDVESGKFNWLNVIDVRSSSRLREYKRTTPAEVVWEMLLTEPDGASAVDWSLLFAEFLPSINPAELN